MRITVDRLARTRLQLFGWGLPAFQVCGYTGLAFAIVLDLFIAGKIGLSIWLISALMISSMATFLVIALATKIITGEEQLIYYHQEIAILLVCASLVRLLHRPVLPYIDVIILGVGTFLAFGRIGCLMVGCCHGRPHPWGIRYGHEHAEEGFAKYLVGVRLFPIQAVESVFVFFVVIAGALAVFNGRPSGTAFAFYTIGYGFVRFCLEFFRGDTGRPYTLGFSQGQWLSLWLMCGTVWAELTGRMPFHAWHLAITLSLPLLMLAVAVWRKFDGAETFRIRHPQHVGEIAQAIESAIHHQGHLKSTPASGEILVVHTSIGFSISAGAPGIQSIPPHFTISGQGRHIAAEAAIQIADVVLQLKPNFQSRELRPGMEKGVFHLVVTPPAINGDAA